MRVWSLPTFKNWGFLIFPDTRGPWLLLNGGVGAAFHVGAAAPAGSGQALSPPGPPPLGLHCPLGPCRHLSLQP